MASKTKISAAGRAIAPANTPKFVDDGELHGRWAYERLFGRLQGDAAVSDSKHERELFRFKQMHFCGRRMNTLVRRYGAAALKRKDYKRFAEMHKRFRDEIAAQNLGLVYDLYKRSRFANVDGDELLSQGMLALTRSIDTFNPWKGFRFSTYACNAILRAFYRCGLKESRRQQREPVNFDVDLEKSDWSDTQRGEESLLYIERLTKILADDSAELTAIERDVLEQRFPLDQRSPRRTLADIGKDMNLSKERVRQIQETALGKLRDALDLDPVLN